jgi:glucose-6-phosphate isomerase
MTFPSLNQNFDPFRFVITSTLDKAKRKRIMERIWSRDHTVWKTNPAEITNRLGWLDIADRMKPELPKIKERAKKLIDGHDQILLLGMGGSSLAPEVLFKTFGAAAGHPALALLDSTDPAAVLAWAEKLDPNRTLFLVSTKSGGTVETFSFMKYFFRWVSDKTGKPAGPHFVAITDPGSGLEDAAKRFGFKDIFLSDPNIGGRFSALTPFGLVPAALIGADIDKLVDGAIAAAGRCMDVAENPGLFLGIVMAELAKAGLDKLTFFISPGIASFGDWVEQLIAESTGKEGRGILPVVGETAGSADTFGPDRVFVHLRLRGDETHSYQIAELIKARRPLLTIELDSIQELGGQFFLWEMATAVACHGLSINAFDQPNVESAKIGARKTMETFKTTGALPKTEAPSWPKDLAGFLTQSKPGDYIAVQAYLAATPDTDAALAGLRLSLRDRYKLAVTTGYGPRFLHSTGQLHKGDKGNGLFIQLTCDDLRDAPIPDEPDSRTSSISFGVLKAAQAMGDRQALLNVGRRVIQIHLGKDILGGIAAMA